MSALQGHGASDRQQRVLDQFYNFPFSSDEAFQQGLSDILAHGSISQLADDERSELVLKTKLFYFNRITGYYIGLADVQARHTADLDGFPGQSGNDLERNQTFWGAQQEETRTLTLAELKSLIEQGRTGNIPNNKFVPNVLNDGVPSESTAPVRRKPWEGARPS